MLVAPPGKLLVSCDLSQAETWVVAYLAKEETMKHFLLHSDIHTETACVLFDLAFADVTKDQRFSGKKVNHASSYRMSPPRFVQVYNKEAIELGVPIITHAQSKVFNQKWHSLFMNIKGWWNEIELQLGQDRTLWSPYGRRFQFFDAWGDDLFKEATACIPQSTVADHFNGYVQKELGIPGGLKLMKSFCESKKDWKLVQQGHDSGVLEVPKADAQDCAQIFMKLLSRPIMIKGETFTIPVDGEIGEDWGHMEKIRKAA